MKKFAALLLGAAILVTSAHAQSDKSKRPSPPATVTQTIPSGATITIDYSQPSLKGRTIGKDVEPMMGQLWRAGANEATTINVSKPITIEGKTLPGGKYAMFMMPGEKEYTVIFNAVWQTWGAYDYEKNKGEDALKVKVAPYTTKTSAEKLTYTIDPSGTITLNWGTLGVDLHAK